MTTVHGCSLHTGKIPSLDKQELPDQSEQHDRMFPNLNRFSPDEQALKALGNAMKHSSSQSVDNENEYSTKIPSGYTYLGQFICHDISFNITPLGSSLLDPSKLKNFRTPRLDLDSLYGAGPIMQPYFYELKDPDLFAIGLTSGDPGSEKKNPLPYDIPRAPGSNLGLIADPRNDENLIISQLHLVFLKFHNKVVQEIKKHTDESCFKEARELVTHHYQWIILHDFLPCILNQCQLNLVLENGPCFYKPTKESTFIPVEFSAAAYRLGHSMVRQQYNYNGKFKFASLKKLFAFTTASGTTDDNFDVPIPNNWIIDWKRFFNLDSAIETSDFNFSRKLDPFIVENLGNLPNVPDEKSLAVRNLLRGRSLGLPSGQDIAEAMGIEPLTEEQISQGSDGKVAEQYNFLSQTPLWYYILKEAQIQEQGNRLGQVGSRIVAEVFVGLLKADQSSFLFKDPEWKPMLTANETGKFTMPDLLNFVGDFNPIGNVD